ncbi:MAG: hypothetical protein IJG84_05650 [Kiritimatiellae bacterium]|nr:hypothetical protein [Kiritimatiellia bacterium]
MRKIYVRSFFPVFLAAMQFGAPFSDNAVLQRGMQVPIWGKASPGETVTVEFAGQKHRTVSDGNGRWRVDFAPMPASKIGRTLTANGLSVSNVVVGEVWFASGQSNMECPIINPGKPRYRDAKGSLMVSMTHLPFVRFVKTPRVARPDSAPADIKAVWRTFEPASFGSCGTFSLSATAFYYARELYLALDVPIGIVDSSWGGSQIDAWTPRWAYENCPPELKPVAEYPVTFPWKPENRRHPIVGEEHQPCVLWNGMVSAFAPMAMRGGIWSQGCSNCREADVYALKLRTMYDAWRSAFENRDMSFYIVQLASFRYWHDKYKYIMAAQERFVRGERNAAIVVTADIGNLHDVHYADKETVAQRLAAIALKRNYAFPIPEVESPVLEHVEFTNGVARMTFGHAKQFYVYAQHFYDDPNFEVAGEDGAWHPAKLQNVEAVNGLNAGMVAGGNVLSVRSAKVPHPVRVRYLDDNDAVGTVFNEANLPLGYFEVGEPFEERSKLGVVAWSTVRDPFLNYMSRGSTEAS